MLAHLNTKEFAIYALLRNIDARLSLISEIIIGAPTAV